MAEEILKTEKETSAQAKELQDSVLKKYDGEEAEEKPSKYMTRNDFDSILKIHNKIIEGNFNKLKSYTDNIVNDLCSQIKELKKQLEKSAPEQKTLKEEPKKEGEFCADDVAIDKIFYSGNK